MENATKALIIAAGVFLGLMILSLGIYLYSSLGTYVEETNKTIEENALNKFNTQFFNYINYNSVTNKIEFELKIQDIVTVANIAYENNKEYDQSLYHITVNMTGKNNLEQNINNISAELLANNIDSRYKCTINDIKINSKTGRVYEVNFTKIPN